MNIVHKWQIFFVFAFATAFAANAGHVAETLALSNGWNAVYIESTPDGSSPGEFFADMPPVQRDRADRVGRHDHRAEAGCVLRVGAWQG